MNSNPYASPTVQPTTAGAAKALACPLCGGPLIDGTLRSTTFINWYRNGRVAWLGNRISRLSLWSGAMVVRCHRCLDCGYIGIPPEGPPPQRAAH